MLLLLQLMPVHRVCYKLCPVTLATHMLQLFSMIPLEVTVDFLVYKTFCVCHVLFICLSYIATFVHLLLLTPSDVLVTNSVTKVMVSLLMRL